MNKNEFKKLVQTFDMNDLHEKLPNVDMENDLQNVDEWEKHDIILSELREKALETYEKLLDMGINADPRFADKYFESAVKSLEIAVTAEKTKIEKKLEMIKIKLSKRKTDLEERRISIHEKLHGIHEVKEDEGVIVIDRNRIIDEIMKLEKEDKNK